jgi:xylulokinase
MEGVTYHLTDIVEILRSNGADIHDIVITGGGARGRIWRQMLADSMNAVIHLPAAIEDGTSLGAAITGALGVGLYSDYETAVKRFVRICDKHEPNPEAEAVYRKMRHIFDCCYRALEPIFPELGD